MNIAYNDWTNLVSISTCNKWKSSDRSNNLKFLEKHLNIYAPIITLINNGNVIRKIIPNIVETEKENFFKYGHLEINNKKIRLNSNLDINNSVQFPIEEVQHFLKGDEIFFTCGDLFLIVNCKKLYHLIKNNNIPINKTKLKNYEVFISDLFDNNLIDNFGYINMQTFEVESYWRNLTNTFTQLKFNYKTVAINPLFHKYTLRGCLSGLEPRYIAAAIEMSDSEMYFQFIKFMNRKNLVSYFKKPKTPQGIGYLAKLHTENCLSERPVPIYKNLLKKNKKHWIILDLEKVSKLETVRKYCELHLFNKPSLKKYKIHWAVKHAKYCRSTEEYNYYKKLFIQCHGIKEYYNEEEIQFFKDCFKHKSFKYLKNINYNYYD